MWRERDMKSRVLGGGVAALLALAAGCAPDGPDGGAPTHPTDTYSVTLEWEAPTTDAVGQPLDDLSGYRLYYAETGSPAGSGTMIEVGPATRARIQGLSVGEYLFAVTALDTLGNESELSDPLPVRVGP